MNGTGVRPAGRNLWMLAAAALSLAACSGPTAVERQACAALKGAGIPDVDVVSATSVTGGRKFSPKLTLIGLPFRTLPPSCRVHGVARPTPDSHIAFEVWLPAKGWNGKFLGLGNGGQAGNIDLDFLTAGLQRDYAVVTTDTGHTADRDGSWAFRHPERARDYGYRGIHEATVAGKALVRAFYGREATHAYFSSASNGGRAALMEAQRYPEDYDGVVAGAPALNVSDSIVGWTWTQQQLLRPGAWLAPEKLKAVEAAALKACDSGDGVVDGVIDDPRTCRFAPEVLQCKGQETKTCLTAPQLVALKAIYSGPPGIGPTTAPYRGFMPGGETGWIEWITGKQPGKALQHSFSEIFVRYLVYGNPKWQVADFDLARDGPTVKKALGPLLDPDPDLSRFIARGGKLIIYHGWSDPALEPQATLDYYQALRAKLGAEMADRSVRLYMLPGLQHVAGGPGPNGFGQLPPGDNADPSRNIYAALESWVETGRDPGVIVAAKYNNTPRALLAPSRTKVFRTRPICPYPQVARWTGKGSTDLAANFRCTTLPAEPAAPPIAR